MGRSYVKKTRRHKGDKPLKERYRTKRKTKDIDEIQHDLKHKSKELIAQSVDIDKPGNAQHYCLHCAKYFINEEALKGHFKGRFHKRRLKNLSTEAYSQEEADRASGMGSYVAPKSFKTETQSVAESMDSGVQEINNEIVK